jgi:diadenosine tetraphosphate (Ap4A) HIT family hydrolase
VSAAACAFLDHEPVRPGHALVVPRQHVSDIAVAGAAKALAGAAETLEATARLLLSGLPADGIRYRRLAIALTASRS